MCMYTKRQWIMYNLLYNKQLFVNTEVDSLLDFAINIFPKHRDLYTIPYHSCV